MKKDEIITLLNVVSKAAVGLAYVINLIIIIWALFYTCIKYTKPQRQGWITAFLIFSLANLLLFFTFFAI